MEATDDSLLQQIEYVDTICLDKNIILPEGCTSATITTENGEAVTLILSQDIANCNEAITEVIEENDSHFIHNDLNGKTNDDPVAEEPKTVYAIHFPSSSKSASSESSEVHENQNGTIHEEKLSSGNSSDNDMEQSDLEDTHSATNLEDFMDVVTTYKCKFCRFSCPWKSGLVSHIRCCHIQENKKNIVTLKSDKEPNIVTASKNDKEQQHIPNCKKETFSQEMVEPDTLSNSQDVSTVYNQDSSSKFPRGAESETDSEHSTKSLTIMERHIFLCGQCSDGFMTLEDCKQHMVDDHNIKLDQNMIKPLSKRGRPRTRPYGASRTDGKAKVPKRLSRPPKNLDKDFSSAIKKSRKEVPNEKVFSFLEKKFEWK